MVAGHVKKKNVSSKNNRSQLLFFGETGLRLILRTIKGSILSCCMYFSGIFNVIIPRVFYLHIIWINPRPDGGGGKSPLVVFRQ